MKLTLKLIIIPYLLGVAPTVMAAVITPEKALERAGVNSKKILSLGAAEAKPTLEHTVTCDGKPTIYLFKAEKTTLCISAEDKVVPVLGYADNSYSFDKVSPTFGAWLNTMSEEIASVRSEMNPRDNMRGGDDFSPILPLCQTQWNQDAPYYNSCPKPRKSDQHCYTGCVATAMAQVMKYHNWPDVGEGSVSYRWDGGNVTLRLNFANFPFNWDKMLDIYRGNEYSDEEGEAVAKLMQCCGYAVEMNYSTSGSGALSQKVGGALGNNFKYDKSKIRYVMRDYYTLEEWEAMIYNSLKDYGPVILDGQSNEGGHSFVCDGYDSNGYFHINWGWGGISDGYYLLSVLDPFNQGIGGSGDNSGFNYMQDAVINITPAKGENGSDLWIGQLYSYGEMGIDVTRTYALGEDVGPLFENGVYNFGPAPLPSNTAVGLLMRSDVTGEIYIEPALLGTVCNVMYGFAEITLPLPSEIPEGSYRLTFSYQALPLDEIDPENISSDTQSHNYPASRDDESEYVIPQDGWIDVLFPIEFPTAYQATVKDGTIQFEESSWRPTGIEEAALLESNDPVRYFNLQGMELKEPVPGEITVVKKGAKVKKVMF